MGRAFEYRKARKMKRWDFMAKAFTKVGREIAIAVKESGPDPETNPKLRLAMQNAKGVNMPKDRVEAAIKRASDKDASSYDEIVYEGYGPHGVAFMVECATDNSTRTVANIRSYFNKSGGSLGVSGSVDFMFERKGVFHIEAIEGKDKDEFELEFIDHGLEKLEVDEEENEWLIYTEFQDFGKMQSALEEENIDVKKAELQRIPLSIKEIDEAQGEEVMDLIDKIEQDDDVQQVFTNLG